jgi:hypothetical protein
MHLRCSGEPKFNLRRINMKKILAIVCASALIPMAVSAKQVSSKVTVEKIYTYKTAAVIKLSKAMKNDGCTYSKSGQFVALRFAEDTKEMYSALLTAFVSGKKVIVGASGCDNIWSGDGTMNKVYRVTLTK